MDFGNKAIKAKYQLNRNLYVTCYLDVIDATAEHFKVQVGIHAPADTVIPVGTRLYLCSDDLYRVIGRRNELETFYVTVEGVEIIQGKAVQVCSPLSRETITNRRAQTRTECHFDVQLAEIREAEFTVIGGTLSGLTLVYKSDVLFGGLILDHEYRMNLDYREHSLSLPVRLKHIHYDWRSYAHLLGVKILSLGEEEKIILTRLLDPAFSIDIKSKSTIDADEARIRPDM